MTKFSAIFSITLLFWFSFSPPAVASGALDDEQIRQRAAEFQEATERRDYRLVIQMSFPPKMISTLGTKYGISEEQFLSAVTSQTAQAMEAVEFISFSFELDNIEHRSIQGSRHFALLPTITKMRLPDGRRVEAITNSLVIEEDSELYFIRVAESQQAQFLTESYPEFSGVTFPPQQTRILSEDE